MSIATFILGESGTGKSASMRNLDGKKTALIQVTRKPLPFSPNGWTPRVSDSFIKITEMMDAASKKGYKIIIIDDFQYLMANEFMSRAYETGFNKFTEIARHAWDVLRKATTLPDDVRVYILSHVQTTDDGTIKAKTIGKLLDEKITIEGMVTIVLRTAVADGRYLFRTVNNGYDTVKAPMGMFKTDTIENDINAVDDAICAYYGINKN